jgi:hypothetical protein
VELWHDGRCVARHERCYQRQQQVLELEHYLDVLYLKPGALAGSRPLEQQRRAGLWPDSFDQIWQSLMDRHGKQSGTRQMIELLKLVRQHGTEDLIFAHANSEGNYVKSPSENYVVCPRSFQPRTRVPPINPPEAPPADPPA